MLFLRLKRRRLYIYYQTHAKPFIHLAAWTTAAAHENENRSTGCSEGPKALKHTTAVHRKRNEVNAPNYKH